MLLALAFVSEADVLTSFTELCRKCLAELHDVYRNFLFLESQRVVVAQPQDPDIQYHYGVNMKQLLTNHIVRTARRKTGTTASDSLLVNTIQIFT